MNSPSVASNQLRHNRPKVVDSNSMIPVKSPYHNLHKWPESDDVVVSPSSTITYRRHSYCAMFSTIISTREQRRSGLFLKMEKINSNQMEEMHGVATGPKSIKKNGDSGDYSIKPDNLAGLQSAKQALKDAVILPVKFSQFLVCLELVDCKDNTR